jgi:hypothetical protein
VIIAHDTEDVEYTLRKLVEECMKWGLQINFGRRMHEMGAADKFWEN